MIQTFDLFRQRFTKQPYPELKTRLMHLASMRNMIREYSPRLCDAISQDFGNRCPDETKLTELFPLLSQIKFIESHLSNWMQVEHKPVDLFFQAAQAKVLHVPLGVVGVMTPWNFPLLLALSPALTALAGGNLVMIKMSEWTPKTAQVLREAVDKHLNGCVKVFEGDLESNKQFSELPFDHLFFTGSPMVGSLVMQAASKNLTPVTLELGGKCPVFAAPDVKINSLVEKLIWAKSINAGQVCISPDYLLLPEDRLDQFIELAQKTFHRLYPQGINDPNYTSIINERHFGRLNSYLREVHEKGCRTVPLAVESISPMAKTMIPHLIINPPIDSQVMREEIFGPLLPIITYGDFKETKKYLDLLPNPLALYLFTHDPAIIRDFEFTTASGGLCINDLLVHFSQEHLPFGGVKESGMGHYHGLEGFLTFTRPRSVFKRGPFSFSSLAQPPYQSGLLKAFYKLMKIES